MNLKYHNMAVTYVHHRPFSSHHGSQQSPLSTALFYAGTVCSPG